MLCQPAIREWGAWLRENQRGDAVRELVSEPTRGPLIATGHQASLWHPGILAKDLAMVEAARRFGAQAVHLVVDHDNNEALQLELPVQERDRLSIHTIRLAAQDAAIPTGCQIAPLPERITETLRQAIDSLGDALAVDLSPLLRAYEDLPPCRSLAEQVARVTARLMEPYGGRVPLIFSSDFSRLAAFEALLRRMVKDAPRCVAAYNTAVRQFGNADVPPLSANPTRVELPLWALRWNQPRQRVFVDLSNSRLILSSGESITDEYRLAPRALLLSAFMRRYGCALFIRGQGGAEYDRAAEQWWREWMNESLPPVATVSADVTLPLDVPVADRVELDRARWRLHFVPHNIDRVLGLDDERSRRKRHLLERMNDNRDSARRRAAFDEIHRINAELAVLHPEVLHEVRAELERAQIGWKNRRIALKRDWCFALYPPVVLRDLAVAFAES